MEARSKAKGFSMVPGTEDKCIWMEAGVIDFKLCSNHYNCHSCAFDKAMKETADRNSEAARKGLATSGKKSHIVVWNEKMRQRQGLERKCRHSLSGRAPVRLCPYNYECSTCAFDQMLEDGLELQLPFRIGAMPEVEGYRIPDGHFFHIGHAWARVENGGRIRVGLDDFSTKLFGKADKFDLPLTGEEIKSSEIGLAFKRSGKEAGVLSPIAGVVAAVNYNAAKEPGLVKEEPYNDGWLMVLEPVDLKKNLKELLYGATQTADWIGAEHQKLMGLVSQVGVTMADGGTIEDVIGNVPTLEWDVLTKEFLRT
ncbi:MAG: glycine cleavage system protein H [Desulfobacteraceae bacterium]|nr:glycine cleavage system protein H [Desulfobacteraceae bacterium]